jgi:hypothetical protein
MNYTMKYADWQWLIEPEPKEKKYLLKYKRPAPWTDCSSFDTPEAAADAVARGTTGQKEWDEMKRELIPAGLASWLIDPTGGALAPIIPVVSEILRSTILSPGSENAKDK